MFQSPRGLLKAEDLTALLESEGVAKSSVIHVTGLHALPAILWLCRHEYQHVSYIQPAAGALHEEADAVLFAHTCDEIHLKHLLRTAREVRTGGVLIFQIPNAPEADQLPLDWMLQSAGFVVRRRVAGERRTLFIARRNAAAIRRAA